MVVSVSKVPINVLLSWLLVAALITSEWYGVIPNLFSRRSKFSISPLRAVTSSPSASNVVLTFDAEVYFAR